MKLLQKSCTDCRELTSICITWSLASFIFVWINLFAFSPASTFLTAITTCTPRKANTRVVSRPIPLDAPAFQIYSFYACFGNTYYNVIHVVVVGIRNANDYFIILIWNFVGGFAQIVIHNYFYASIVLVSLQLIERIIVITR